MFHEWFGQEHHRLHIVEQWPEGPHKEAVLASIRSKLDSLLAGCPEDQVPQCSFCLSHRPASCVPIEAKKFHIETESSREWAA